MFLIDYTFMNKNFDDVLFPIFLFYFLQCGLTAMNGQENMTRSLRKNLDNEYIGVIICIRAEK